jgi:succinyl-CoA synthetase beta subunit
MPEVEIARQELADRARQGQTQLFGGEALAILDHCGVPTAPLLPVSDHEELMHIVQRLGYPIVLKLDAADLAHKTEVGGVVTDVRNEEEALKHYDALLARARARGLHAPGVMVQPMVRGGVEMALGMIRDPKFGPMVMCGLGGIFVEVVKDISFKIPPISRHDAHEMIMNLKGQRLLTGYRGALPVSTAPMEDALVRIAQLVTGAPYIQELDINPFMLCPDPGKSCAIDARIVLGT